jgi:hypothetical protein
MNRPRIYYVCHDHQRPTGGNKHSYDHVDLLNANGFEAYALHGRPGFRYRWFPNETRTMNREKFRMFLRDEDYVVLPEDMGPAIGDWPGRKVIFNKNAWYGFSGFGDTQVSYYPYLDPNVVAVFAVSEHNLSLLRWTFPKVTVLHVVPGIDAARFMPRQLVHKQRQIACSSKDLLVQTAALQAMRARTMQGLNSIGDWRWQFLRSHTEGELARTLSDSPLLLYTSLVEGIARLPLEAALSGTVVATYRGGPQAEYLPEEMQLPPGDLQTLVRYMEDVAADVATGAKRFQPLADAALKNALRYSRDAMTRSVLAAWDTVMSGAAERSGAPK